MSGRRVAVLEEQLKMQQSVARIDHKEMEGIQEAMLLQLDAHSASSPLQLAPRALPKLEWPPDAGQPKEVRC